MSAAEDPIARRQIAARPPEIEEWLNGRVIHPLSDRLTTTLVPTGITPNMVSAFGVVASAGAGIFYAMPGWPVATAVAFLFHLGWHVFDGSDGDLARRTGKSSPSGEIVDGICDYLSHVLVYGFLAWVLSVRLGDLGLGPGARRRPVARGPGQPLRVRPPHLPVVGLRPSLDAPEPVSRAAAFRSRGACARGLARGYLAVSAWASADDARCRRPSRPADRPGPRRRRRATSTPGSTCRWSSGPPCSARCTRPRRSSSACWCSAARCRSSSTSWWC